MVQWKTIAGELSNSTTNALGAFVAKAESHYAKGEVPKARGEVDQFLESVELDATERLVTLRRDVAEFCRERGDAEHGAAILNRSIRIVETYLGSEHVLMAIALANLGMFDLKIGEAAAALPVFERCLQTAERAEGRDSLGVAAICGLLQTCHKQLGRFSSAEAYGKRTLEIREQHLLPDDSSVMTSRTELAMVYQIQAKYSLALPLLQKNLIESEKNVSPDILSALQAKESSKALTDFVAQNRAKAVLMAESYGHSGALKRAFGKFDDAHDLILRCRLLNEILFGRQSLEVANSLLSEAETYSSQQRHDLALPLLKEAYKIYDVNPAKKDAKLITALILVIAYKNTGQYAEAMDWSERALIAAEATFGTNSFQIVTPLMNLACIYRDEGQYARALPMHQRSIEICGRSFGKAHPLTVLATCELVIWHIKQGIFPDELFEQGGILSSWGDYLPTELPSLSTMDALGMVEQFYIFNEGLHSLGNVEFKEAPRMLTYHCAQGLAMSKALLEELSADKRASKQNLTLTEVALSLPADAALLDIVQYRRWDYSAKNSNSKEQRYAAYLTFPLARDSTNVVVERVDLGEAAPINDAVELVCKRMSAGQFAAKDLAPALQRLSQLIYTPLAPYLTKVSHLVVCPDGQLSRLPFEMLSVGNKFLIEDKTISYVTSGREVVRIAKPLTRPAATLSPSDGERAVRGAVGKSLVMGNPDFDFDLLSSRRESALTQSAQFSTPTNREQANNSQPEVQSQLTLAATRSLSRDYRGLKFSPLPGSGMEATNVAKLLGNDAVLRLGRDAREAELKAVQSPRVLHLATHGFFLSDQEFKRTNSLCYSWEGNMGTRWNASLPREEWENPLVRCGIALAGANHTMNLMNGRSRIEEALTSIAQPSTTNSQPDSQSLLTSAPTNLDEEDGLLTGLEASLLNLQGTELVILSACDTGTGEVRIGEGVMSLRRAFRIAGAETVLASHWKVSDKATSQLMTEFMRRWRAGEPRAKAWREAQLSLLRSKGAKEDFSNPFFWAAFTLTGQWN
jgi:CHAT domain-containing protein/tetratricopeptide (TPR) repeat protein